MKSTRTLLGLVCVLTLVASAAEAQKKKKAKDRRCENIPLLWSPTDEIGDYDAINLTGLTSITIEIGEFIDGRRQKELIGQNLEDQDEGLLRDVSTPDDVAAFVADHTAEVLGLFGFAVGGGGDAVLSADLRRFYVTETGTYEGDVSILFRLHDAGGELLYEGMSGGSASRWGRSYKAENYYETLSDSLMEAVHRLASSADFRSALEQASS